MKATKEQVDKWAWQKKQYGKGEDPIDEWRKRRANGQISDLENQYGDPEVSNEALVTYLLEYLTSTQLPDYVVLENRGDPSTYGKFWSRRRVWCGWKV